MDQFPHKNLVQALGRLTLVAAFVLCLVGCAKGTAPTATLAPTATPTSAPVPQPQATPTATLPGTPTVAPRATPTPTPTPTVAPEPPGRLTLELLSPQDGAGVEMGAIRVLGLTRPDAVVAINGTPVEVEADGSFQRDLVLEEGVNGIEVIATDLFGHVESEYVAVFFISTTAGLSFSLFYPFDGLQVSEPRVQVVGGTRQDAVVGVNGVPVDVNAQGIFATTVSLEEGANFIEVVAADVADNVRFQTVSVFYVP